MPGRSRTYPRYNLHSAPALSAAGTVVGGWVGECIHTTHTHTGTGTGTGTGTQRETHTHTYIHTELHQHHIVRIEGVEGKAKP